MTLDVSLLCLSKGQTNFYIILSFLKQYLLSISCVNVLPLCKLQECVNYIDSAYVLEEVLGGGGGLITADGFAGNFQGLQIVFRLPLSSVTSDYCFLLPNS